MSRAAPLPPPLTIWIVSPHEDIPGEGLPPQRARSLARILAGRGHDVTWWTATWSQRRKAIRRPPPGIREDEGFSVRLVAVRPYEKNLSLARFASDRGFGRTFERLASESIASGQMERPDIILATLPPLEGPEASVRLARRLDALVIVDVVEAWPESVEPAMPGPKWLRRGLFSLLFGGTRRRRQAVLEAADAIAATTEATAAAVLAEFPPASPASAKPLHCCGFGTYLQEYPLPFKATGAVAASGSEAAPRALGGPIHCVHAGTLESGRDLDTLVAAARMLSAAGTAAVIHVAGSGDREASLRRVAASLTGSCRMQVHGLLDRAAYARLLADCDTGIVLAGPEAPPFLPATACDYAAAGLALVHASPGELDRSVEAFRAGISFTAGDAVSLAAAIAALAGDPARLLACRQAARRLAEADFDREKTYSAFAAWMENLAD
ncbi:MAG: hypothetical protein EBZ59_08005 [Planctomycetia bacterium]|nr:hypothetical protein [Planctomycetia bacterium]